MTHLTDQDRQWIKDCGPGPVPQYIVQKLLTIVKEQQETIDSKGMELCLKYVCGDDGLVETMANLPEEELEQIAKISAATKKLVAHEYGRRNIHLQRKAADYRAAANRLTGE